MLSNILPHRCRCRAFPLQHQNVVVESALHLQRRTGIYGIWGIRDYILAIITGESIVTETARPADKMNSTTAAHVVLISLSGHLHGRQTSHVAEGKAPCFAMGGKREEIGPQLLEMMC